MPLRLDALRFVQVSPVNYCYAAVCSPLIKHNYTSFCPQRESRTTIIKHDFITYNYVSCHFPHRIFCDYTIQRGYVSVLNRALRESEPQLGHHE